MPVDGLSKFAPRPTGAGETFQLFRDGEPRTRASLVAATGQSRSTVAARIDALVGTGLLGPSGEADSTGGRPPATFAFRPHSRIVLGVDLGAHHARIGVTDLAGTVLTEHQQALDIADGPDAVMAWVRERGHRLIDDLGRPAADLAGIGVGVPGPVDHASGRPISPPIMPGWDGFDIAGRLGEEFRAPVVVDNDANVMALGEHRAIYPSEREMLFVKVATGIGSGIVMDGRLRHGAQGAAGDLGHLTVPGQEGVPCRCGNTGCLEAVAGVGVIAQRLREAGVGDGTVDSLLALVRSGDVTTSQQLRQSGRHIGVILANAVSLLNPARIVIGGVLAVASEQLIAGIREVVYQRSLPLATEHLVISTARAGSSAGIVGAATMVADEFLAPSAIEALITV
ncbi:ROK family protein [Serinibacter salmoneus]|uniref:ROK family protein n=1 Tax=Serinibacter salmoneus TaxID=556530 RepID=UPI001FE8DCEB|nr:ROK family protein [Serinibacter salmoneus]